MGAWDLFSDGRTGRLAMGMSPIEVQSAFGEPDDWAINRRNQLTIFRYDEVELHFYADELGLVHAEVDARNPRAFTCNRLGLGADELVWPIDLDELATAAEARSLTANPWLVSASSALSARHRARPARDRASPTSSAADASAALAAWVAWSANCRSSLVARFRVDLHRVRYLIRRLRL